MELQDGAARFRYRSPQRPLRVIIGNSRVRTLEPTGEDDSAERTIEDIDALDLTAAEARSSGWQNAPLVLMLHTDEGDAGRWQLVRGTGTTLEERHAGLWIDGVRVPDEDPSDEVEGGALKHWPTEDIRFYAQGPEDVQIRLWPQPTAEEEVAEKAEEASEDGPVTQRGPRRRQRSSSRRSAPHSSARATPVPSPARVPSEDAPVAASVESAGASEPQEQTTPVAPGPARDTQEDAPASEPQQAAATSPEAGAEPAVQPLVEQPPAAAPELPPAARPPATPASGSGATGGTQGGEGALPPPPPPPPAAPDGEDQIQ
jgi:hypothetical protein